MAEVLINRDGGIVTVTFNRPEKKNALNVATWHALDDVIREATVNPADRAVVLTGSGGAFSAGADLSARGDDGKAKEGLAGGAPQPALQEMRMLGDIVARFRHLPKPTLAVVDGPCVGVALGLVLACDLVLASDRARFSSIFVKRGLSLDGGTSWTLPRAVGMRQAKRMAIFGDMDGAADALNWGLITEVVPAAELEETGREWAARLAAAPTTTVSLIKRLLDDGTSDSFEQAIENEARSQHIAHTTGDVAEGIAAFLERRAPRFTGQ